MDTISPWLLNINADLSSPELQPDLEQDWQGYHLAVYSLSDSCWLVASWPKASRIAFRLAYSPGEKLRFEARESETEILLNAQARIGKYAVRLALGSGEIPVLQLTSSLTPAGPLLFPYWPRDIVPLGAPGSDQLALGEVLIKQVGSRSGQLYIKLTRPQAGTVLYLQNLTALVDYHQQTETSAADTVGGEWPEIGFALPPTLKNKPLEAGKNYVLSDAFVAFSVEVPADEPAMVKQYLDLLAAVYLALPKPETTYKNWPETLQKGLTDLIDSPGCWSQVDGNHYFNAYVCDYATPPEIMVQLAVLLPLLDYVEWSATELEVMRRIKQGLPAFYDENLKTIVRWHPKAQDKLEGEEEQKEPMTMDSWYLHHPLLNLSRLALKGDKVAEKLFLDSLDFAIKVARHFDYNWPVFYHLETLEVIKAETQPGMGGEKDVPGLYAHVMLQAWELTGEKRFLAEAEKSAQRLRGLGFSLMYQANNTAFAAGALLRLYKITKKETYLELSYLCLANLFKNVRLWDCNYGFGRNFPSFFTQFPLNDAPYSAVYEEQEVFCAFHDYLRHAEDVPIQPSARLLVAEYIRYLVDRAMYYYPPMLPKDMLQEKPKIGEVDPNLWIALEDLHDGWEKGGQVGQEVYGAGNAFGIMPRHYLQVPEAGLMIYTDYPIYNFAATKHQPVQFRLAGDGRINCRLMIVKTGRAKLPEVTVKAGNEVLAGKSVSGGNLEYLVAGDAEVKISWPKTIK
jgi:hypothetical protein